ncbi:MAG: PHP domain-containing protein [bacterium]
MFIDLQLHSTYSDGYLTPTELAGFCVKNNIKIASLTDHNTVSGFGEFKNACARKGIKPICGMELYCKLAHRRFNILWYNFEYKNPELHKMLRDSQIRRRRCMRSFLQKLSKRGLKINIDRVLDKYTHYIPINHVIDDIMAESSNVKKIKKHFGKKIIREENIIKEYFYNKEIGILRDNLIDFKKIVRLRKEIGGQLVLCHPAKHRTIDIVFWEKLKKLGLDGIEVLSPHHSVGSVMAIQNFAKTSGLVETGGSDFHRVERSEFSLQNSWQYFKIDAKNLRGVEKVVGKINK